MKGTGKIAGIAVMVIGTLIALFRRLDIGSVVGVIGYIVFNPNVIDKIGARRTSTTSEDTPKDTHPGGKNNVTRVLIAIVVLGILGAILGASVYAYQNRKSRDETLEWMQDFLPKHPGWVDISNGIWSYTLKHDGCWVTIAEHVEGQDVHEVFTYQFSLTDLDPTTIKADDDGVSVEAHDARHMIHMYVGEGSGMIPTSSFAAVFYNKTNADRFAKALKRAVNLCGGKA